MDQQDRLSSLMAELGPQLDLDEVSHDAGDNTWSLARDDATVIAVQYHAESGRLCFSSEIAALPEEGRLDFCEFVLQFNFLWVETGGLVLAIDRPGGNLVLQFACGAEGLEAGGLQESVAALLQQTDLWREVVAGRASPSAQPGTDLAAFGNLAGVIRA